MLILYTGTLSFRILWKHKRKKERRKKEPMENKSHTQKLDGAMPNKAVGEIEYMAGGAGGVDI